MQEVFYDRINQNTVILEDFNMEPINQILETFLEDNGFANLIKSNTCFKSTPGSYTDLILTNKPKNFQNTKIMETGINYHHAFIFSFPKATFTKMPTKSCNVEIILNNCPKKLVILIRKKIFRER